MFDNLTMEIFYYSLIPVVILALITLFILLFSRKKEDKRYKYSYIIKVLMIIMISLVLPLITGYTIWFILRYLAKGTLLSNIGYVIILVLLIIALIILLVIVCRKLYKSINKDLDEKKEVSNE